MAKSTTAQCNVTNGEISPRALGRFDIAKYVNSVKKLENFLIYQLGGALFRPGTTYVAATKDSTAKTRLIPFQYSTTQAYVIEMGNLYMRFYANNGVVGGPFELATPYTTAEIFQVQYTQDADTMYLVHPNHMPQKLQRLTATTFSIADVPFIRGPFQDKNVTAALTITPSADTGAAITLTATSALFDAKHVGSLWRVKGGVVKITAFTSNLIVTGDVQAEPDGSAGNLGTGPGATADWAEGAFSEYRGYPAVVSFHEQRLIYANTAYQPQTFWGSQVQAYDNFLVNATVLDTDSFQFTIASGQVNAIRFISSGPSGIEIGTSGGTFSNSSGTSLTLTPSNPNVHQDTNVGVAPIMPKRISSYLYYMKSNLVQVLELVYDWLTNREKTTDMTLMADHILRDGGGAVDLAYQQSPNERLWVVRSDGQMAVFTRNAGQEVMGWSRIVAGSDATGPGEFESVATIVKDGEDDQIWVIVKRVINGNTKRYVEYFNSEFFTNYYDPIRVDSSLSYDNPIAISMIDQTKPVVVHTTPVHGFAAGDKVKIDLVEGMTEVNTNVYTVKTPTAHTFELYDNLGVAIDGTAFSDYFTGGVVRKMLTHFSGLDHLTGEVVAVQTDGGLPVAQQLYTVVGGAITLLSPAAVVHVGLPYSGTLQMLKQSDGTRSTGQTKPRRIYQTTLRVHESIGCFVGQDINNLQEKFFGTPNAPLTHVPNLYTGDFDVFPDTWWDREVELIIQQQDPLPLLILAIIIRHEVEEK